jgi:hypothetical protein
VSVRRLLAGQAEETRLAMGGKIRARWIAFALVAAAVAGILVDSRLSGESRAMSFMGAGALVLVAILSLIWDALRGDPGSSIVARRAALARLAVRNGARFPLRSTFTIGLMAAACFLIVSVSAFQLAPPSEGPRFDSGDGGFLLLAQCDQPIYQDLNAPDGRRDLSFDEPSGRAIATAQADGGHVFSLRVQAGDDASCLNLYQPRQPRVLGVPPALIERGGFAWAATDAKTPEEQANPWLLLAQPASANSSQPKDGPIPVVLDQNTALYSLHLSGKPGEVFKIDRPGGGKIEMQVVGLLKDSIFQGDLLTSEADFLRLFPDVSGYRYFLISSPPRYESAVTQALEVSPQSSCETSSSGAASWHSCGPPDFAAAAWHKWSCWKTPRSCSAG